MLPRKSEVVNECCCQSRAACHTARPRRGWELSAGALSLGLWAVMPKCPMCLVACYWAQIPRLVFGASTHDVATYGFEDLQLYRELTLPLERRSLAEHPADEPTQKDAAGVLRAWADRQPVTVQPKY